MTLLKITVKSTGEFRGKEFLEIDQHLAKLRQDCIGTFFTHSGLRLVFRVTLYLTCACVSCDVSSIHLHIPCAQK